MTTELRPYDHFCVEDITHELFHGKDLHETEDGLIEIPADSYQLILNGLSEARWFTHGSDRDILLAATSVIARLRDQQKRIERSRLTETQKE